MLSNKWIREGLFFFTTFFLVIALDQVSKLWIRAVLSPGQSLPNEGILRLTLTTNTGAVFGLFASQTFSLAFSILALVAILFLSYYYLTSSNSLSGKIALGLMLGGGLGNLLDRLRFGHVTDFIDLRLYRDFHWPTFNLADLALVIGLIFLIFVLLSPRGKRMQLGHRDSNL